MDMECKSWLYDISKAIEEIESFLTSNEDEASFEKDLKKKRAVERNIEIIGEAMNRILHKDAAIEFSNARKIV